MSEPQLTSVDLTASSARARRDELADRIGVLDKVGVLRCLPDDFHATTDMVAEFYQVDAPTIRQSVNRNREELDDDGYDVIVRGEVSDKLSLTPDELGMPRTSGSIALFPRRAVLRIGMLLRDSPVARRVRDHLLDTEQSSPARELTDAEIVHRALQITTRDSYGYDGFKRQTISALALIKDRYGDKINEDKLVDRLAKTGIVELNRSAKAMKEATGNPADQCYAHAMVQFYNQRNAQSRVDPWWNLGVIGVA